MADVQGILATDLAGLALRNPVLLAAGCCGTLDEIGSVIDLARVGGVVSKSITPLPRPGNDPWRILDSRAGMLNAIGLANPGIDAFETAYLPRAADMPTAVICSVAGFTIDDYVMVAGSLDEWWDRGVRAIELNVSCPNVQTGAEFGAAPATLSELVRAVRAVATRVPLFVKLSPIAHEPHIVARAAVEAGAHGLTICNTIPAMEIDVDSRSPRLANVTGGLSGPALHPVAVRLVSEVYRRTARDAGVPIIAAGGVMTWRDAAEFILAGASAVAIGTGLFVDPRTPIKVAAGLERWVRRQGASRIGDLTGAVRLA